MITNLLSLFSPRYRYSGRHRAPETRPRHAVDRDPFSDDRPIWDFG